MRFSESLNIKKMRIKSCIPHNNLVRDKTLFLSVSQLANPRRIIIKLQGVYDKSRSSRPLRNKTIQHKGQGKVYNMAGAKRNWARRAKNAFAMREARTGNQ